MLTVERTVGRPPADADSNPRTVAQNQIEETIVSVMTLANFLNCDGKKRTAAMLKTAAETIIKLSQENHALSRLLHNRILQEREEGQHRRSDYGKPSPGRAGNNRSRPAKNRINP